VPGKTHPKPDKPASNSLRREGAIPNRADFIGAQLHFPRLRILAPADFLKEV